MQTDSIWWPRGHRNRMLFIIALFALFMREHSILGLAYSEHLLFGWLPVIVAYEIAYSAAWLAILCILFIRLMPIAPPVQRAGEQQVPGKVDTTALKMEKN